jgi:hypothetical protein
MYLVLIIVFIIHRASLLFHVIDYLNCEMLICRNIRLHLLRLRLIITSNIQYFELSYIRFTTFTVFCKVTDSVVTDWIRDDRD